MGHEVILRVSGVTDDMATFAAVNTALSPPEGIKSGGEQTPTTPTPSTHFNTQQASTQQAHEESAPETPTRNSFGGLQGQKPLSDEPVTPLQAREASSEVQPSLKRNSAYRSDDNSPGTQDVDMGEGDDDNAEDDGSDNDSVTSDSQRPSKKKKGQRFFCQDFPPCQLSFTRSEHLARHIRYVPSTISEDIAY